MPQRHGQRHLLHQWDANTGRSQQWKVEHTDDGFVRFRSVLADKYLDLYQAFSGNGARAQIWEDNEGSNQRWVLRDVTDKNAIRPSAAQMEKKLREQVEEAAKETQKAAKKEAKGAKKTTARKSTVKKTATARKTTAAKPSTAAKKTTRTKKAAAEDEK